MGWVSDEGTHEGYFAVVFADVVRGRWSSARGIGVGYAQDGSELLRSPSAVAGWRLCCDHRGSTGWEGSTWSRAADPEAEDVTADRLFCSDGEVSWVLEARPDVELLVGAEWLAHVAPKEALSGVREAAGAVRACELVSSHPASLVARPLLRAESWGLGDTCRRRPGLDCRARSRIIEVGQWTSHRQPGGAAVTSVT